MKILITGATGFIGRNIAESLHSRGYTVLATGRSETAGKELEKLGISFTPADITNKQQLSKAADGAKCIIHCAAKAGDWGHYDDFYNANVIGTRNLILVCKEKDIKKIIFISTPSIYFSGNDRFDIRENDPLPQRQFHYGKTKLISEKELLALADEGFKTIILRPRAVYGKYDNTIVPRILKMAEKKNFPLINGGSAKVDITYIGNLVNAVVNCLDAPDDSWNEIYNISNGSPVSLKEWFAIVLKIFGLPFRPKYIPERMVKAAAYVMEFVARLSPGNIKPQMTRFSVGYMAKSMTMSIEKAADKLGYVPEFSNEEGFRIYKEWYNSQM